MGRLGRIAASVVLASSPVACDDLTPKVGPILATACQGACGAAGLDGGLISFARDLRPLMDRHGDDPAGPGCRDCHYDTSPSPIGIEVAGLDMTTLGALRKGGATTGTKIVIPGDPEGSGIVQKLRGTYPTGTRMPQSGPPFWTDAQIQLMADWIAQGAVGEDSE